MNSLTLAGSWLLALGSPEPQFPQNALPEVAYLQAIELPATTETRGKGPRNDAAETAQLTRPHKFDGPAWYRRDLEIPAAWTDKRIRLRLERTKYTQVWFDGQPVGEQGLYTAAQEYDLTPYSSMGRHTLTVMVDNRAARRPVQAEAHQFSDNTQTNWNGILGGIELQATDPTWIEDVQVHADLAARAFKVRVRIGNISPLTVRSSISATAESFNHPGAVHRAASAPLNFNAEPGGAGATLELDLPLGDGARPWDEFSPALYRVKVRLDAGKISDERTVETGLREFRTRDRQFTINGRATYLRGKHDGCVFPLTGHPPMDTAGWERYLRTVRDWGFNHVRCHTWVPPEAAFAAADRLGMYLQPELPFWGTFDAKVRDWLRPEAEAVLRAYGNHPSFVMLTLANEAGGDRALMNALVEHLRKLDPRHLYADGSNNVLWDPQFQPTNDFMTSAKVRPPVDPAKTLVARGSFWVIDGKEGHTQWGAAETRTDFAAALAGLPVPFVGHETGQWSVFPDFRELPKYTGVTRPRNLERFRDRLARSGQLEMADAFHRASGVFAAELYREENELALRTPGSGGFQHLDLQDFPGQGTALVGLLDAFMDSKGIATPEEFRRSCGPLVPLARFDKYTWTTAETYLADLQLAHYGPADLKDAVVAWSLVDAQGKPAAHGEFPAATIAQGGLRDLGRVTAPLAGIAAPARLDLEVTVTSGETKLLQRWPVWVYPAASPPDAPLQLETMISSSSGNDALTVRVPITTAAMPAPKGQPAGVALVRAYDADAKARLARGERVVLIPDSANWAATVPGGYTTDYWNWPMFNGTPGTMGFLIEPAHPALALFPTKFHSERQWSEIAHASSPVILSGTPAEFRPLVQVIDNCERNEKLGLIFEARVGRGRLLVCAVNLLDPALAAHAAPRQLLASLLAYAGGEAFAPAAALDDATLARVLRPSLAQGAAATASGSYTPPWGFIPQPKHAFDGDINTRWRAADDDRTPWLALDLGRDCAVDTLELRWGDDEPGCEFRLETSADGATWTRLPETAPAVITPGLHRLTTSVTTRHLRLAVQSIAPGRQVVVREWRVLGEPRAP